MASPAASALAVRSADDGPASIVVVGAERQELGFATATAQGERPDPIARYCQDLSEDSAVTMRRCLVRIAREGGYGDDPRLVPWHTWTNAQVAGLRAHMIKAGYSAGTINLHIAAVRGVLKACRRLRLMSENDRAEACDVKPVKDQRVSRGRMITAGDVGALLRKTREGNRGARDRLLLALLFGLGMRIHEPGNLTLEHLDAHPGQVIVPGKGKKERLMPLPSGTARALSDWLERRGRAPGPLLCPVYGERIAVGRGLSRSRSAAIVMGLAKQAGVKLTTHDLRRSYISQLLLDGVDALLVAKLAGHSDLTTTRRYDVRDQRAAQAAVERFTVPYEPKP